jgi:hypothetical protein
MRTLVVCLSLLATTVLGSCDPADDSSSGGDPEDAPAVDASSSPHADAAAPDADLPGTDGGSGPLADSGFAPDSGTSVAPGPPCPSPSGSGATHAGSVTADETWTAADSPHVVTSALHVTGATVTIEPCAVVRLRPGVIVDMRANAAGQSGELVAHGEYVGTTRRPIVFDRDDAAQPWGSLRAFSDGRIDLEHVDLKGGGDHATAVSNGGTLIAEGVGGNDGLTRNVRVVDVVIEDSAGFGVNLQGRAAFTDNSDSLTIRGAGSVPPPGNIDTRYPVYVTGAALSTIPSGSYTGNARDELFVAGTGTMNDAMVRFGERGVPYRLESHFGLQPMAMGGLSTLVIEAGTVIRFATSSNVWSMTLGSVGSAANAVWPVRVIANGTPQAPIVLTSADASPVAGSWGGVEWHAGPATGNVMSNVRIEFAGGDGGNSVFGCGPGDNDAALFIGKWVPSEPFIEGCTFSDSAGGGIVCGWSSDDAGPCALFAVQNTFEDIGNDCDVSYPADGNGGCPTPGMDDCYSSGP